MGIELISGPTVAHGPAVCNPCSQAGGAVIKLMRREGLALMTNCGHKIAELPTCSARVPPALLHATAILSLGSLHHPLLKMPYFSVHLFCGRRQ